MKGRYVATRFVSAAVLCASTLACSSEVVAPVVVGPQIRAQTSSGGGRVLADAPYSADLQSGTFIVCTGKEAPAGTYTYLIELVTGLPSDRYTPVLTQSPGECSIVFSTNRRGGPIPSIRVTSDQTHVTTGSVLFDGTLNYTLINGQLSAEGYDEGPAGVGTNYARTLSGFDGAVVKFYYFNTGIGNAGGHGGTGTLNFTID